MDIILAIAGKPGLFKLVSRGNRTLIVETIDDQHRRFSAGMRDRVTSLGDVTMYADNNEDAPLMRIFQNVYNEYKGETPFTHNEATPAQLDALMDIALPTWDRDRVHQSDIRKLIQWFNILVRGGYTEFYSEQPAPTYGNIEGDVNETLAKAQAAVDEATALVEKVKGKKGEETPAETEPAAE